ncbi:hypothetical protein COX85_00550, partial [Candidatus Micrarchaeota archaeon CG_4_10_14_0_2_um_filter_55_9]
AKAKARGMLGTDLGSPATTCTVVEAFWPADEKDNSCSPEPRPDTTARHMKPSQSISFGAPPSIASPGEPHSSPPSEQNTQASKAGWTTGDNPTNSANEPVHSSGGIGQAATSVVKAIAVKSFTQPLLKTQ